MKLIAQIPKLCFGKKLCVTKTLFWYAPLSCKNFVFAQRSCRNYIPALPKIIDAQIRCIPKQSFGKAQLIQFALQIVTHSYAVGCTDTKTKFW